ncbi:glycosyltransferase [Cyanobium sp. ULC082]
MCDQRGHSVQILLNERLADAARDLRKDLHDRVGPGSFRVFSPVGASHDGGLSEDERRGFNRRLLQAVIDDCQPDVLLIGSLFEDQSGAAVTAIEPIRTVPTAVIAYDLIPFLHPDTYLSFEPTRIWYHQKIEELKRADLLLAISHSTKGELEQHLGIEPERVVAISTGGSAGFSAADLSQAERLDLQERFGLAGSFLYGNGMVEPRKNLDGLIRAYALLPRNLQNTHQLCISTSAQPQAVAGLRKLARSVGITDQQLVIAGHLSDADLALLYRACTVFVFPSWHEGFGLPVLEAMQCGAAVLTSNRSSLPEVMGRADALFDPFNPAAIAERIEKVLRNEPFRLDLKAHAAVQARRFSWQATAAAALAALEQLAASADQPAAPPSANKPQLAYVAPVHTAQLPQHDHHQQVLAELQNDYQVTVISADNQEQLRQGEHRFERVLIALADHPAYSYGLELLESVPAVVELLASQLDQLYRSRGIERWLRELQRCHGYPGLLAVAKGASLKDLASYPCTELLESDSLGVIGPDVPLANLACHLDRLYQAATPVLGLLKEPATLQLAAKSGQAAEAICQSLANSLPRHSPKRRRQLLVDISVVVRHDGKSGIQRVIKGVLSQILRDPCIPWQVEPIYLNDEGQFLYARAYSLKFLALGGEWSKDEPVEAKEGDAFLGLDLNIQLMYRGSEALNRLSANGAKVHFVVYDIIPILCPDYVGREHRQLFTRWLEQAAEFDHLICISKAVAEDVELWLQEHPELKNPMRAIRWFHLGSALDGAKPSHGLPENAHEVLTKLKESPTFLFVSTIEPRKGHFQLYSAANLLWDRGELFNLVFVGRQGWNMEQLATEIRQNPLHDKNLHWLEGISDEYLDLIYKASSCCINPSMAEGFGLPVVEAARYGIPLLLRDLKVFQEVAGHAAKYFTGDDPAALANAMSEWMQQNKASPFPPPEDIKTISWQESAEWLLMLLEKNDAA